MSETSAVSLSWALSPGHLAFSLVLQRARSHEFSPVSLTVASVRAPVVSGEGMLESRELVTWFIGYSSGSLSLEHCDLDHAECSPFRVKTRTAAKYGLSAQPRLVDIIAAVPPQYRKVLVPKLKAKPIRTASGVSDRIITY